MLVRVPVKFAWLSASTCVFLELSDCRRKVIRGGFFNYFSRSVTTELTHIRAWNTGIPLYPWLEFVWPGVKVLDIKF